MRRALSPLLFLVSSVAGAMAIASCQNPVHDNEVAALGDEAPGVDRGPNHRPGQPCLVCHGGDGPSGTEFAFAGTVYQAPVVTTPMVGATVKVTDANKNTATTTTNSVGNFYLPASGFTPTFPVNVELDDGKLSVPMFTHIGRDGSCASCHFDPLGPTTPGHVYLVPDVADVPDGGFTQ